MLLLRSVLPADIQDPNSNAIATQYCNSNLSREMCSNRWLCQDSRIYLLKVLNRPTTDVDFWTASQWNRQLTTASQAVSNILRGETAFRQNEHNVESFSSSGSLMLLAAIRNALQRLPQCCSPAQSYLLTFKIRIQMPLPRNIAIAIYPGKCVPTVGCAKTQESIYLKSSIGQLLM